MRRFALLTAVGLLFHFAPAGATDLEVQREAFRAALSQAEAGRWGQVEPLLGILEGYPLLPDLRAAWLRSQLGRVDDGEVRAFLQAYPALGFSAGLRQHWADSLARRGAWADYLALYDASYASRGDTALDCLAFTARIEQKLTDGLENAAVQRWLSPVSQPKECDRAFAWLEGRGVLTPELRRQRMELALDAGQFGLARWLARALGEGAMAEVTRWERMHANPATSLDASTDAEDTPRERALLLYGFHRLVGLDPASAAERWPRFRERFEFDAGPRAALDRRIALLHAWRHLPGAIAQLEALPAESHDASSREWKVRMAIRAQDWPAIEAAIARLDPATAAEPVWRYWQARALEARGLDGAARLIFEELAQERGYYSFLSADRIEAEYQWAHTPTPVQEGLIATLQQRADMVRTRELFFTGQEANGRIEWQQALARLSAEERVQAGLLAKSWGWYSRAITAAAGGGVQDDLELRFPLPWRSLFEEHSHRAGISSAWVYGVARSESLFMPDVSSVAGAVGLMQLMPATGQVTARRAGMTYQGRQTLLDPAANISLGTRYLAEMLARYGQHRVLATAAYNAGPGRVDRWLPQEGTLAADAWVDSVPFGETRSYVQRVLASEAVFHWRMSGKTARISEVMQPVPGRSTLF
jgi:soluble lytic murein transglycosylase